MSYNAGYLIELDVQLSWMSDKAGCPVELDVQKAGCPRLGWLDHQRPRVIDRPVPELVVQLLET